MQLRLDRLPARTESGDLVVVIEAPRGSGVKLKFEPALGAITLGRPLPLGVHYPFDWGFVPSTCAADGDPLDAMVLHDVPTHPGVVIPCAAIGVVKVSQKSRKGGRERNDRILAVPTTAPRFEGLRDARSLPERTRDELAEFFVTAVHFADKAIEILGWGGPNEAERTIEEAIAAAARSLTRDRADEAPSRRSSRAQGAKRRSS
jgi:inorganic pyrophosphatase